MKKKSHNYSETPIVLQSEGHQLIGILHESNTRKLVVMCHGFTGNKIEDKRLFVEAARHFAREDFNAFRFDFYGSGDSDGEFADTLISHNITNLKDVLVWARAKEFDKIAVLGLSMGAAAAILTLEDMPVDALITWSAVPDMGQVFNGFVENLDELTSSVEIYEHDGWLIKKDFWQDAMTYDIRQALATLSVPKLFVQGTEDAPVFISGFHNFRDVVMPPADFMEIPDADHTFQRPMHRRRVIRQTSIWLKRHLP